MSEPQQTMGIGEFAAHINRRQSYVSELKKAGRLVLTSDGRRVVVAESIARIAATREPSHQGVADRHAAARGEPSFETGQKSDLDGEADRELAGNADYQTAKAYKARYDAMAAKRDYLKAAGELVPLAEHNAAMGSVGSATRHALESLCNTLPPILAGRPEADIRSALRSEVEAVLGSLSAQAGEWARKIKEGAG